MGDLEQAARRATERRVELHRDDELALPQRFRESGLTVLLAERLDELALGELERSARFALLLDRGSDRGDLGRRRAAAAADHPRAQRARVRGELGEVLRRRVRVDDAAAGQAREADVRQRGERPPVGPHLLERFERGQQPAAVVRADRCDVELVEPLGRLARRHARERLGAFVEGHQRDDRQARDAPHRLDRVDELLEVVERLDHEEVGAAALEDARLLAEELAAHPRGRRLADRPDRAGDEDVAAGDLPRLSGQLDRRRVDPLEVVLQELAGQLAAVGAEGVRLDQIGAGVDEADVERDDRLGGAQIGLFGRPQPGHRGRDQRAHAAVGHDRRAGPQPGQKPVRHGVNLVKSGGQVRNG